MMNKDLAEEYPLNRAQVNPKLRFWISVRKALGLLFLIMFMCNLVYAEPINTNKAIIHHSASPDVSVSTIDKWHKERGWKCIGYHFVIRANGQIERGRPLTMRGAHAKGRNQYIGICLTGYNHFTQAQLKSLIKLLKQLKIKEIEPHHEKCPGKGFNMRFVKTNIKKYEQPRNIR